MDGDQRGLPGAHPRPGRRRRHGGQLGFGLPGQPVLPVADRGDRQFIDLLAVRDVLRRRLGVDLLSCAGDQGTVAGTDPADLEGGAADADRGRYRRHHDPAGTRLAGGRPAQVRCRAGIPQRRLQGVAADRRGVPGQDRRPRHLGLLRRGRPGDRRTRAPDQPALGPRGSGAVPRPWPASASAC